MTFTPEHIFTNQTPTLTNVTDAHGVTIGTKFRASVDGQITGIRWFYPTTLPASAAQGVLYSYTSETSGTSLEHGHLWLSRQHHSGDCLRSCGLVFGSLRGHHERHRLGYRQWSPHRYL